MKIIITIISLFFIVKVNAQISDDPILIETNPGTSFRVKSSTFKLEGDPFLGYDYSSYNVKGAVINNIPKLRFNYNTDEMEFLNNQELYILDKIPQIDITLLDDKRRFIYLGKNINDNTLFVKYAQLIYEGTQLNLFKREFVFIDEELKKDNIMESGTLEKSYKKGKTQFLIQYENNLYLVPTKKNDLLKLPSFNKFKSIIEKEKINLTKEQELIRLINLMDGN